MKPAKKKPTMGEVEAQLRAEYRAFTPEQRAIYGDEPGEGVIAGRWARIQCGDHTREQRRAGALRAMSIICGKRAEVSHHAAGSVCS